MIKEGLEWAILNRTVLEAAEGLIGVGEDANVPDGRAEVLIGGGDKGK